MKFTVRRRRDYGLIAVLGIGGLLAVLYVCHAVINYTTAAGGQAFSDAQRRSRHTDHDTAEALSGLYWIGGQRASLGMLVSTSLLREDAMAVFAASQNSSGQTA